MSADPTSPRHEPITREEARAFIDRELRREQSNKVQHGHPSPALWKPFEAGRPEEMLEARAPNDNVNVYQGMPFCVGTDPGSCGFCLFPHEDFARGKELDRWIGYLAREARLLAPYYGRDTVRSVYFGGGTPSLYRPDQYARVVGIVDTLYGGLPDGIEVTLEGLPGLFNEEKFRAMKAAGINRVSMGVQQITDHLIALSGRPQRRHHVLRALELARKYDMSHSIDLIFGWPDQTERDMLDDLATVVELEIPHLTHYELNVAGRSAFARMKDRLPTLAEKRRLYHVQKAFLEDNGYVQRTVYDWQRIDGAGRASDRGEYRYEALMHEFDAPEQAKGEADEVSTRQVCGHGYNAISFFMQGFDGASESWIWANHRTTREYYASLDRGELPVAAGFVYAPRDVEINWLYQRLQTLRIDERRYRELFGRDLRDAHGGVFDELAERGWIEEDPGELRVVGDGQPLVPMIQALLSSRRVAEIRRADKSASGLRGVPVVAEPA